MTEPEEVTDEDLQRLMTTIQTLLEAQARQQAEIVQQVAAAVAPLVHQVEIQTAQVERQSAVIH